MQQQILSSGIRVVQIKLNRLAVSLLLNGKINLSCPTPYLILLPKWVGGRSYRFYMNQRFFAASLSLHGSVQSAICSSIFYSLIRMYVASLSKIGEGTHTPTYDRSERGSFSDTIAN